MDAVLESAGFFMLTFGALGRIWTSLYIAGRKTESLVVTGPYSVVRNPLYFFSLIAVLGLCISAESILVSSLMFLVFTLYYPFVILEEERKMLEVHGQAFLDYAARTPRLLPNPWLYTAPQEYLVDTRKFARTILDTMWFFWAFGIIQLIERLHEWHILPMFFRIP